MGGTWFFVALVAGWGAKVMVENIATTIKNRVLLDEPLPLTLWNAALLLLLIDVVMTSPLIAETQVDAIEAYDMLFWIALPLLLTLMALLLMPAAGNDQPDTGVRDEGRASDDGASDDEQSLLGGEWQQFDRNRFFFFGALVLFPIFSFVRELIINGALTPDVDFGYRLAILAIGLVGMFVRGYRVNVALPVVTIVVVTVYMISPYPLVPGTPSVGA